MHGIKKSFNKEIKSSETKFNKGSLRSGQKIEYEGSIVVLGDVNGGAEVIAGDNVIVLGVLRGLAHAGAYGNKKASIASASIDCKQIRIADIIKEMEEETDEERTGYGRPCRGAHGHHGGVRGHFPRMERSTGGEVL